MATVARPIDKVSLKAKYAEERAKRIRADGTGQYLELKGQLAHYAADPYTQRAERAPIQDHVTFAFIGGGFAGAHRYLSRSRSPDARHEFLANRRVGHLPGALHSQPAPASARSREGD